MVRGLAVTGCGVLSPAGAGLEVLADALDGRAAASADTTSVATEEPLPEPVWAVPDFRIADQLGRKGTRNLDRTTGLGLVACRTAIEPYGGDQRDVGVVVTTGLGSVRSISEFARDTWIWDKPHLVDPRAFPNTVMNSCAGQIAIRYGMRGVNATVAGGHVGGLHAIRYARNAVDQGQAERLVVGGVEELCAQTAWAWRKSGVLDPGMPVGEACAFFALESRRTAESASRPVLAELLACEVRFVPPPLAPGRIRDGLADCIERALARSGVGADEVELVATGADGLRGLGVLEERVVAQAFPVPRVRVRSVVGEVFSATASLQLAAVLARWRADGAAGRVALITSLGLDGNVGCLVVRSG
ncbi:beta-ketoacyl synthase N-terminal-like domain-containing protein [Saccharopolyspora taberi]|uniref:Beta-ketoacyl-ACP synthase II n=1 Tax=Saccharopolyspora taberi TaxID=60895 RepID=A0ABN3V4A1_9PSEU